MKRLLINTLLIIGFCQGSFAQTRPQQSMYMFNYTLQNPAATGIEDYGQVRAGFRRQWVGITGAPTTAWLSGDVHLKSDRNAEGPEGQESSVIGRGHGVGFNMYYDEIGPYSVVNLNLGYAYHLPLSPSLALSAGFSGGVQHTRYDISKSTYPDQPIDPAVIEQSSNTLKKYSPDLNAGIMLNGKKFFAGVSLVQIMKSDFIGAPKSESSLQPQWLASAGYMAQLDPENWSLWLSGTLKSDFIEPVRFDFNAKARYRDVLWIGALCRMRETFGAGFGVNISRKLTLGYMYEWEINRYISSYSKGSHELCLGLRFIKEGQSSMPKMGW